MTIIQFSDIVAIVTGAAQAVRDEIIDLGCGDVNRFCPLVPGEIAWDECDCGQFAQTITQTFPSNSFPTPAVDTRQTACGPQLLAVNVTASLTRCVPVPNDNGSSPTCDALLDAAIIMECDRQALRTAITCYLLNLRNTYRIHEFTVGNATSVGPQGGCAGIELTYQFGVANMCCP
jgi:hypothetical protein